MRWLPLLLLIGSGLPALACGGPPPEPAGDGSAPGATFPLTRRTPAAGEFILAAAIGDTLRFRKTVAGGTLVLARYRRAPGGIDSMVATADAATGVPISSFRRIHGQDGSVTAQVVYGAGFDGQARLTRTSSQGQREDNLRTPGPFLDAAQLPLVLQALDFGRPDTLSFNYVAPFEARSLPAQLAVGELDSLPVSGTPAYPVHLQVSGLEERYWFAAQSPHDLLRYEEPTRNVTWVRP